MWNLVRTALFLCGLWAVAGAAMATTCDYYNSERPSVGNMPLQATNITVGRDVPDGTVVHRQRFSVARIYQVACTGGPFNIIVHYRFTSTPKALSSWNVGPYAGKVYLTDVPGLGVAIVASGTRVLPLVLPSAPFCIGSSTCEIRFENVSNYELMFVKIGDIAPGTLQGASLPTLEISFDIDGLIVVGPRMGASGSINVVSQTCRTPDQTVALGTYMVKDFRLLGTAGNWTKFSIELQNCPAFLGMFTTIGPSWVSNGGTNPTGTMSAGTKVNNILQFQIDPVVRPLDAGRGILGLNPAAAGMPAAAAGMGIQIGRGVSATTMSLSTAQPSGLALLATSASYKIDLSARYVQTAATVRPGPANASATFTIIYN